MAAVLAFIPLTQSVFWGSMAFTLIGGTAVGTVLTLVFLPALYAIWFKIGRSDARAQSSRSEPLARSEPGFVRRRFQRRAERPLPTEATE